MSSIVSKIAMPAVTDPPGELMYRLMSRFGVLCRQQQQLRADLVGDRVVDSLAEKDDSLSQQPVVHRVVEVHPAADTPHVDRADRLVQVTPALADDRGFWGHS